MASTQTEATVLTLRRTFQASRKRVFEAWTQPEAMSRWMAPSDAYEVKVPEADIRVGGRYRLEMHHPDSGVHRAAGTYKEVSPYEKLVFTWEWDGTDDIGETLVSVELLEAGEGTELVLTHERFPDAHAREQHAMGWEGCLSRLDGTLAAA